MMTNAPPMELPKVTTIVSFNNSYAAAWDKLRRRLFEIRAYQNNWDDEGAKSPNPLAVDVAIALLQKWEREYESGALPGGIPTRVAATGDGGVYIDWQRPGGEVSLEIHDPNLLEWMFVPSNGAAKHWTEHLSRYFNDESKQSGFGTSVAAIGFSVDPEKSVVGAWA